MWATVDVLIDRSRWQRTQTIGVQIRKVTAPGVNDVKYGTRAPGRRSQWRR